MTEYSKTSPDHAIEAQDTTPPVYPPDDVTTFGLLAKKRFSPFFWTQFLGAFNDNVFKNALLVFIAFEATRLLKDTDTDILTNLAGGLFILPFFLFSYLAGQVSDKYEKSMLIRRIKACEIIIMIFGALAFYFESVSGLLLVLFLMGTQSAFFGPIKYSIIPQSLKPQELVSGNALVEMGTFIAILAGTVAGAELYRLDSGIYWVAGAVILFALLGFLASRGIPYAHAANNDLTLRFNPFRETANTIRYAKRSYPVFLSVMAVSWFWFLGSAYLIQIPNYVKAFLYCEEGVVTLLLAMFIIGIASGSILCNRLSSGKVELGLVPIGAIGLSVFGFDLYAYQPIANLTEPLSRSEFLATPGAWRLLADFLLIGAFGGIYSVPLYSFILDRTEERYRSRVIAALNIINSLFMVVAAIVGIVFLGGLFDLTIPEFFVLVAILNVVVSLYIFSVLPEFFMRLIIWLISRVMYRIKEDGLYNIPSKGPALLICNHVSFVDGIILAAASRRPPRFVMEKFMFELPIIRFIAKGGKAIPIASQKSDPKAYNEAFEQVAQSLSDGDLVCIFPEGRLTRNGEISDFRPGILKILEKNPVPVVPIALRGLWGSIFSHYDNKALKRLPKRFWRRVEVVVGPAIAAKNIDLETLRTLIVKLRGDQA